MKISEFVSLLDLYSEAELQFLMPEGRIAAHSHVTEVGRIERLFIDCGGKPRRVANCNVQMWEYTDTEHRLTPGRLSGIFDKAAPMFGGDDLPVEIEFEHGVISQYPVKSGAFADGKITFELELKHTACLALELCAPADDESSCCGSSGCCE
jgi:Family of unknown function (DUF6428)